MAKPTQLPQWATDGAAVVAPEPSGGKKATGFIVDERPPVNWINWLFLRIYQWCLYLSNLHNEVEFLNKAYTWTNSHVFEAAITFLDEMFFEEDIHVHGHVKTEGDFRYEVNRTRTKMVPFERVPLTSAVNKAVTLALPHGASLTRIRAVTNQYNAAATGLKVSFVQETADKVAPYGPSTVVDLAALWEHSPSAGYELADSGAFNVVVDNENSYYKVIFTASDTGDLADGVTWIEVEFSDRGPTNA